MKLKFIFVFLFLFSHSYSQTLNEPFGQGFSKSNRKAIEKKFNKLLSKVSEELDCPKDSISYIIVDKYTQFYSDEKRHLPQIVVFNAYNKSVTYVSQALSGAAGDWQLGTWKREK